MTGSDGDDSGWDFFISYTQADRAWAEWIAWQLEEDRYRVLVQAWDFVGGSNWVTRMQDGVTRADRTIALLSTEYLTSVYGQAEWQAAWAGDPLGDDHKLLTVRVTDCDRPGLLAQVVGPDVFGCTEAQARGRLRRLVTGAVQGRTKPGSAPAFPGAGRAVPRRPDFPGALPTVWKVPARNANFTGRERDLTDLAAELSSGSTVTVRSVHGMGGVGKTQLVTEYAYRNATDYDLVWWIDTETPALVPDQFTALAAALGQEVVPDPDAVRAAVHESLRTTPGWLLIFDNAEDMAVVKQWLPAIPLKGGTPGHVLVTTRRAGFAGLGKVLDLDVLPTEDAVALLRTRLPSLPDAHAIGIAEALGCLPLALEQAAAYLDQTGMPPVDYLLLLRTRLADLACKGHPDHHRDTIATLWDLSLQRIAEASPSAVQVLDICAYLAPEPIPLDLFTTHPELLPEPLSAAASDPLAFSDALAVVTDYSLAKRSPSTIQLHRLVQAVIRARHTDPGGLPGWDTAHD